MHRNNLLTTRAKDGVSVVIQLSIHQSSKSGYGQKLPCIVKMRKERRGRLNGYTMKHIRSRLSLYLIRQRTSNPSTVPVLFKNEIHHIVHSSYLKASSYILTTSGKLQ